MKIGLNHITWRYATCASLSMPSYTPSDIPLTMVGGDTAALFWIIFWILACTVVIVFVCTIIPPLRSRVSQMWRQHPRFAIGTLTAYFSLFPTYLLGAWMLSLSSAHVSMLFDGQAKKFIRDIFFSNGKLNLAALICSALWIGFQAAAIRLAWMLLMQGPRSRKSSKAGDLWEYMFSHPDRGFRTGLLCTTIAFILVGMMAPRYYPAQLTVDRDMIADNISIHRLSDAKNSINDLQLRHAGAKELRVASAQLISLATASAARKRQLDAAVRKRNRILIPVECIIGFGILFWLLFGAKQLSVYLNKYRPPREIRDGPQDCKATYFDDKGL